jgi:hypothetical protein
MSFDQMRKAPHVLIKCIQISKSNARNKISSIFGNPSSVNVKNLKSLCYKISITYSVSENGFEYYNFIYISYTQSIPFMGDRIELNPLNNSANCGNCLIFHLLFKTNRIYRKLNLKWTITQIKIRTKRRPPILKR